MPPIRHKRDRKGRFKKSKWRVVTTRSNTSLAASHKILASKQTATMRYFTTITLDPGLAGFPATHYFSANSLFDPDAGIGGHQPRGFDQIMALYDRYSVDECLIEVYANGSNEAGGHNNLITISAKDNPVVPFSREGLMEYQAMTETMITEKFDTAKLTYSMKLNQFLGLDANDETLKGSASSNPASQAYFEVGVLPISEENVGSVQIAVRLTYKCTLSEPKNPPLS